jgi:outer membrane protein TolC
VLARNLGMSPDTAGACRAAALPGPGAVESLKILLPAALETRADYLSLASQRQSLLEQQRASRARFYPKLSINGNIGELGPQHRRRADHGLIQGQIDFTVFDRDRDGEAQQLASR